jgi:hypothetical protein
LGAAVDGHESFELAADKLFLALVELDLRLGCLLRRGDEADPLGLELGLAPLALPLLTLVLTSPQSRARPSCRTPTGRTESSRTDR